MAGLAGTGQVSTGGFAGGSAWGPPPGSFSYASSSAILCASTAHASTSTLPDFQVAMSVLNFLASAVAVVVTWRPFMTCRTNAVSQAECIACLAWLGGGT